MILKIKKVLRRYHLLFEHWRNPIDPVQSARADYVAPAVVRIIEAIAKVLPEQYVADYELLSPGQQALADAMVYLSHQRLPQARAICAEAMGDPRCPGDAWVKDLLDAIDIATKMAGTDPEAQEARRKAALDRRVPLV